MTQTAVFDSDFHVLVSKRSEINRFERHRLLRRLRNPCSHISLFVEIDQLATLSLLWQLSCYSLVILLV